MTPLHVFTAAETQPGIFHNGEWLSGDHFHEVRSPYDNRIVATVSHASSRQVRPEEKPAASLGLNERSTILRACSDGFEKNLDIIAGTICAEIGMPITDAENEVNRVIRWLLLASGAVHHLGGSSTVLAGQDNRLALTTLQPHRRVLAITPFNRPVAQLVVKAAPALLAGAPITLKPSERASASAILTVKTLLESGYPPEYLALWTGGPEVAQALLTKASPSFVAFTGSNASAWDVAAAAGPVPGCYELGDVGALIVCSDADLGDAARAATQGAFSNAGQSCRGVKRILVDQSVSDEFTQRLAAETAQWVVGDPADRNTKIGTLIDQASADRVAAAVADARQRGAELLLGGRHSGAQYWPTVLAAVPQQSRLITEEFLAPVAPVTAVSEKAIDDLPLRYGGGLQVGIFTRDLQRFMNLSTSLPVGTVVANGGPQYDHPLAPFGGVGRSGYGREGVLASARNMCFEKTIILPPSASEAQ